MPCADGTHIRKHASTHACAQTPSQKRGRERAPHQLTPPLATVPDHGEPLPDHRAAPGCAFRPFRKLLIQIPRRWHPLIAPAPQHTLLRGADSLLPVAAPCLGRLLPALNVVCRQPGPWRMHATLCLLHPGCRHVRLAIGRVRSVLAVYACTLFPARMSHFGSDGSTTTCCGFSDCMCCARCACGNGGEGARGRLDGAQVPERRLDERLALDKHLRHTCGQVATCQLRSMCSGTCARKS